MSEVEISDFEQKIMAPLMFVDRGKSNWRNRYLVRFHDTQVIVAANTYIDEFGEGNSINDAVLDYCGKISQKVLCFFVMRKIKEK